MPEGTEHKVSFETKGISTVYCNNIGISMSLHDIRLYVAEVMPSEMIVNIGGRTLTTGELEARAPAVEPKFSLVLTPEFARSFARVLMTATERYEATFGAIRQEMTQEQLNQAIAKK